MPKEVIGLYDPRIPPERELERQFMLQVDAQRGTYAIVRKGEQFICTCTCMALLVTSYYDKVYNFTGRHVLCSRAAPSA